MADPGCPMGGRRPRSGGVDSRGGYVSKILYVETKDSGPLGGRVPGTPPDPPMYLSTCELMRLPHNHPMYMGEYHCETIGGIRCHACVQKAISFCII